MLLKQTLIYTRDGELKTRVTYLEFSDVSNMKIPAVYSIEGIKNPAVMEIQLSQLTGYFTKLAL
jgi:hypothetical protein